MIVSNLVLQARLTAGVSASNADGTQYSATPQFNTNDLPSDASIVLHNKYTVAGGANVSIDLNGTFINNLGETVNLTKVYALAVRNSNATPGNLLEVGNNNFHMWLGSATDKVKLGPKGTLFLNSPVDGYVVTPTTADTLKITNPGATSIDFTVFLVGK